MAPEEQVGVQPALEHREPKLLEPSRLGLRERLCRELGERLAAPELESRAKAGRRILGTAGIERGASVSDEPLEATEVELVRVELERIAGRARVQRAGREHLAQPGHVDLHHLVRRLRHVLAPEIVDDRVDRQRPVSVHEEQCEECLLLPTTQLHLAIPVTHFERSEDSKVHRRLGADRNTEKDAVYRRITARQPRASRPDVSFVAHLVPDSKRRRS